MNKQTQEALKMAIDVLQNYAQADSPVWRKALNACKEALEQPAQEVVEIMDVMQYGQSFTKIAADD
jgi:chromosome condensin MukBEF ATPase and DNA-binding subunit MukB